MADARVLVVNSKGGGEYECINEAIKAAVDGDTVQVHMGKYDEVLLLDRAVNVVAEPSIEVEDIVVLGGAVATASGSIQGMSFLQMIDVRQGSPAMTRCDVSLGADGVRVCTGCSVTLTECKIHGAQSGGDGVYVQEGATAVIDKCELANHRVNAVHCNGGEVTVTASKIHDCAFGVYFRRNGKGKVDGNTIDQISRFGVYIAGSSDPSVTNNTVMNCGVSGVMVSGGGLGSIKDNTVHGNVRILQGCSPSLGTNNINGRFDNEATTAMPGSAPGTAPATAGDRKQSVAPTR